MEAKSNLFIKHRSLKLPNGYENFNQKKDTFVDLSDFSWGVEGYDVYQRFAPELTESVNQAMQCALQMTKNTYGNKEKNLDTSLFRQSISVYLKHIHGLRDDSF